MWSSHYMQHMSLDRHRCKLQLDWWAKTYNRDTVIWVFVCKGESQPLLKKLAIRFSPLSPLQKNLFSPLFSSPLPNTLLQPISVQFTLKLSTSAVPVHHLTTSFFSQSASWPCLCDWAHPATRVELLMPGEGREMISLRIQVWGWMAFRGSQETAGEESLCRE